MFDRFWRADSSAEQRYSGLGLGLALAKRLVELHGGTVSANSPGSESGLDFHGGLAASRASRERP